MNHRRVIYLLVTIFILTFTIGLAVLQQRLLNEIFPTEQRIFRYDDRPGDRGERRLTIQLFGIDPALGQAGVLRQFGRPLTAHYFPPEPAPFWQEAVDSSGHFLKEPYLVEACLYTYPTFEIRFFNKGFGTIEIFARDTRFPIGVEVGDPEQRVLDVLGAPPFHHASGDWTARYRFWARVVEIQIKNGRVVRLSW
jgi:hypothetical protein